MWVRENSFERRTTWNNGGGGGGDICVKKHRLYLQLSPQELHETLQPSLKLCVGDTLNFFYFGIC